MTDFPNQEQAEFWSELAPTWLELEDRLEEVGGPPGRLAVDRLGLVSGQSVLDVGCGLGGTTVELASRTDPGEVLGIDIAAGMITAAHDRATRLGLQNVRFEQADAQVDDLGKDRFDAAFSRFGVMFFSDPVGAFANIRKAMKAGASLSFVCWQSVFDNEWMLVPGMAAMSVVGPLPMPAAEEPGPFSLCDPERVRRVLGEAGFVEVEVDPHNDTIETSEDRIPELALTSTRVGAVREALQSADDETRQRVLQAIEDAMRDRVEEGTMRVSRGVLLVSAKA